MKVLLYAKTSETRNKQDFYHIIEVGPFETAKLENTSESLQMDIQFINNGEIVTREDILKLALKHINSNEYNDHWLINSLLTYISHGGRSVYKTFFQFYICEFI